MRGQVSFQFLSIMAIAFVVFTVFLLGFADRYRDIKVEKERVALRDIAQRAHDEVVLAHNVQDGYRRSFELPDTAAGATYSIQQIGNVLAVTSEHAEYSLQLPPMQGSIAKGTNTITREGGVVWVD